MTLMKSIYEWRYILFIVIGDNGVLIHINEMQDNCNIFFLKIPLFC